MQCKVAEVCTLDALCNILLLIIRSCLFVAVLLLAVIRGVKLDSIAEALFRRGRLSFEICHCAMGVILYSAEKSHYSAAMR